MRFKPVTEKYVFDDSVLIRHYPDYLKSPLGSWIRSILMDQGLWYPKRHMQGHEQINGVFINELELTFREEFPEEGDSFLRYAFNDNDRATNLLALCLQNFAQPENATELERILAISGSAYAVMIPLVSEGYEGGGADLIERVPPVVIEASEEALNNETLLREAWQACYSRTPDYEKTVTRSTDVLEGLLRDHHFPLDKKPVLTKFIADLAAHPENLSYKGDTLINPKNLLTDLAKNFIQVRGHHTKGTGRAPTKEEAEFVLHYTIFVWNLYR